MLLEATIVARVETFLRHPVFAGSDEVMAGVLEDLEAKAEEMKRQWAVTLSLLYEYYGEDADDYIRNLLHYGRNRRKLKDVMLLEEALRYRDAENAP